MAALVALVIQIDSHTASVAAIVVSLLSVVVSVANVVFVLRRWGEDR